MDGQGVDPHLPPHADAFEPHPIAVGRPLDAAKHHPEGRRDLTDGRLEAVSGLFLVPAVLDGQADHRMPKAGGKWNTFEITAKGRHLVVVLNGQKTVDYRNGLFAEGPFTLQHGAGVIKFRKVAIKPL
jgi:hypothetical protein